jgi:hypothetical protein
MHLRTYSQAEVHYVQKTLSPCLPYGTYHHGIPARTGKQIFKDQEKKICCTCVRINVPHSRFYTYSGFRLPFSVEPICHAQQLSLNEYTHYRTSRTTKMNTAKRSNYLEIAKFCNHYQSLFVGPDQDVRVRDLQLSESA